MEHARSLPTLFVMESVGHGCERQDFMALCIAIQCIFFMLSVVSVYLRHRKWTCSDSLRRFAARQRIVLCVESYSWTISQPDRYSVSNDGSEWLIFWPHIVSLCKHFPTEIAAYKLYPRFEDSTSMTARHRT